jgi:putative nucleotidyltransferase-like protein
MSVETRTEARRRARTRVRENAFLLAACHVGTPAPALEPSASVDWPYVLRAADRQGVAPLLHDWLTRHPEVAVDKAWADHLHHAYWTNYFRNKVLLSELRRVCDAAAAAGIDLMPLKGASLATDYYPSPALRPLSDLDLLVRPHQIAGLSRVLRELHYQESETPPSYIEARRLHDQSREHCWTAAHDRLDVLIECRTAPLELAVGRLTDLDDALTASLRQHAADTWIRAAAVSDPASVGLRMSPEDLLLHVTTHLAAKHLDFRLIWLHDVARIVMRARDFDWQYFARTTAHFRVAAAVSTALEAAARWIDAPLETEPLRLVRAELRTRSIVALEHLEYQRLSAHVASLGDRDLTAAGPSVWPLGSALSRVSGWRPRLRVLRWVALPDRAYLEQRGTVRKGPLGYVAACARRYTRRLAPRGARGPFG